MTKEEALEFKENWAAINQVILDEARLATLEERLQSLNALYLAAQAFGWSERLSKDDETVRNRWQQLRERFREKSSHDQEKSTD